MSKSFKHCFAILCLMTGCLTPGRLPAQKTLVPIAHWVDRLSTEDGPAASGIAEIVTALNEKDTVAILNIFNALEKEGDLGNSYFKARFFATKARWMLPYDKPTGIYEHTVTSLLSEALNAAYETNNDSLISEMAWAYGIASSRFGKMEAAVTYCLYAAEVDDKLGKRFESYKCYYLGSVLYNTRDYAKSLQYMQASIQRQTDTTQEPEIGSITKYNTVALCYQRMGKFDSAFYFFDVAIKLAKRFDHTAWQAIISGNLGQIHYLQKNYAVAKPLFFYDYEVSKGNYEKVSAANTLQWIARTSLAQGMRDSALLQIKESVGQIEQFRVQQRKLIYQAEQYRQNIYAAAIEVYSAIGYTDSALKYSQLYGHLHDSLERTIADSRLETSQIKLAALQNALTIRNLHKEKEAVASQRNFILLFIILLGTIATLVLNRQRQKSKYRQQLALREKAIAETKAQAAEAQRQAAVDQLQIFTQNLLEKMQLIEKMELQLQNTNTGAAQEALIHELTQQTILTEADWSKFKALFEKIHPTFFFRLKQQASDITLAEQRMAALIRLQLQPKQMASLLGISTNSVYKTKQRLRQRFHLATDLEVETLLTQL